MQYRKGEGEAQSPKCVLVCVLITDTHTSPSFIKCRSLSNTTVRSCALQNGGMEINTQVHITQYDMVGRVSGGGGASPQTV
jgi:hypothetical protein